jgi:hypothetical protein
MIMFNLPRRAPIFFQIWFAIATWYCGITELIQMRECGYFVPVEKPCGTKACLPASDLVFSHFDYKGFFGYVYAHILLVCHGT